MVLLFVFFLIGVVSLPLVNADWSMYHSDASHSGVGIGNSTITSDLLWKHATSNQIWSSPSVVGDIAIIGSNDGNVYAMNASTGSSLWTFATGGEVRSSPAINGGIAYFGSMDDKVYAVNALTGSLVWSYVTGNDTDSSPVVVGGSVFIGSLDPQRLRLERGERLLAVELHHGRPGRLVARCRWWGGLCRVDGP